MPLETREGSFSKRTKLESVWPWWKRRHESLLRKQKWWLWMRAWSCNLSCLLTSQDWIKQAIQTRCDLRKRKWTFEKHKYTWPSLKADDRPFVDLNLKICYETFWLIIRKSTYTVPYWNASASARVISGSISREPNHRSIGFGFWYSLRRQQNENIFFCIEETNDTAKNPFLILFLIHGVQSKRFSILRNHNRIQIPIPVTCMTSGKARNLFKF